MGPGRAPDDGRTPEMRLVRLAQDLEGARCADFVAGIFQKFIENAGFTSFSCKRLRPGAPVKRDCTLLSTRPEAWCAQYEARGWGAIDPILGELMQSGGARTWGELLAGKVLAPSQRDMLHAAAAYGMKDGLGIPIREAGGYVGMVNLAGQAVRLDAAGRSALMIAAVYVYQRVCALKGAAAHRSAAKPLSPREIEILRWITEGKSDWQIGRILAISDKTVNYHIENVKRKFGVATRVQAVVSAIQQGALT